jgi:phage gp36-like protein
MAYSTLSDVLNQIDEAQLIQLTDDENSGSVDETKVLAAISDADDLIDGYLGNQYTLPLTNPPAILRQISVALAMYNLYARRDLTVDARTLQYQWAVNLLTQMAIGKITLGATDPEGDPPDKAGIMFTSDKKVFTKQQMRNYTRNF